MTKVDAFFWWSGVGVWLVAGFIGLLWIGDAIIEWVLARLKVKREFLMWVAARYRDRSRHLG